MADPFDDSMHGADRKQKKRAHQQITYDEDGEEIGGNFLFQDEAEQQPQPPTVASDPIPPSKTTRKVRFNMSDDRKHIYAMKKQDPVREHVLDQEALAQFRAKQAHLRRLKPLDTVTTDPDGYLEVYLLDVDTYTPYDERPKVNEGMPIFRLFGLTIEGYTVALHVDQFAPYFHIKVNEMLAERCRLMGREKGLLEFQNWLEGRASIRDSKRQDSKKYIRRLVPDKKKNLYGYSIEPFDVLRVECIQPGYVPLCRDVLMGKAPRANRSDEEDEDDEEAEQAIQQAYQKSAQKDFDAKYGAFEVFEADILYVLNFLIDKDLRGCGWFRVRNCHLAPMRVNQSRCQIERKCHYAQLESMGGKSDVPPIRIVSVDIECAALEKRFPEPDKDPVICISVNLYRLQDGAKPLGSLAMGVGAVDPLKNKDVIQISFGSREAVMNPKTGKWNKNAEIDMFLAYHEFITDIADPDMISGYNTDNFDDPYLFHRADALGIGPLFRRMGRVTKDVAMHTAKTFSSAAHGTRTDLNLTSCSGRIPWDVMRITKREVKSRSYSLNYQSKEMLGQMKHEISHDRIGPEWLGEKATPLTRSRILAYNVHDEELSYKINVKKLYVYLYQELARVSGVQLRTILESGQGVKSVSLLMRETRKEGFLWPTFYDFKEKCQKAGFYTTFLRMQEERREAREKAKRQKLGPDAKKPPAGGGGDMFGKKEKKKAKENEDGDIMQVDGDGGAELTEAAYQGATVLDPILGFYDVPITTLDFSSLYPSIMIQGNYCWSTWTTKEQVEKLGYKERPKKPDGDYIKVVDDKGTYHPELDGEYIVTAAGHYFVTPKVRVGIIPRKLREILARRKVAKAILSKVKDAKKAVIASQKAPADQALFEAIVKLHDGIEDYCRKESPAVLSQFQEIRKVLEAAKGSASTLEQLVQLYATAECIFDALQNALKITANSMYGFTGAVIGALPCRAIAESVTAEGRRCIERKRTAVEQLLPIPAKYRRVDPKTGVELRPIVIDKIFILFPGCETPEDALDMGRIAAAWLNDAYFEKPMETVLEKYIAPKRYGGRKYEKPGKPNQCPKPGGGEWDLIDVKGVESVRRDNFGLLSDAVATTLRKLLSERDIPGAVIFVGEIIDDLRNGNADVSELIISKALSKEPTHYSPMPAHAQLAEKMRQRNEATAPRVGDRVPYVLVPPKSKDANISTCAEHPSWVLEHDISIHQSAYIDMLRKPIQRLLEPILPGVTALLFDGISMQHQGKSVQKTLDGKTYDEEKVAKQEEGKKVRFESEHAPSNLTLQWAREKSAIKVADLEKRLRDHLYERRGTKRQAGAEEQSGITQQYTVKVSSNNPFLKAGMFATVPNCINCKQPIHKKAGNTSTTVCGECAKKDHGEVRKKAQDEADQARARCEAKWEICRQCVGSIEESESCNFSECSNYFARVQARKDLQKASAALARF